MFFRRAAAVALPTSHVPTTQVQFHGHATSAKFLKRATPELRQQVKAGKGSHKKQYAAIAKKAAAEKAKRAGAANANKMRTKLAAEDCFLALASTAKAQVSEYPAHLNPFQAFQVLLANTPTLAERVKTSGKGTGGSGQTIAALYRRLTSDQKAKLGLPAPKPTYIKPTATEREWLKFKAEQLNEPDVMRMKTTAQKNQYVAKLWKAKNANTFKSIAKLWAIAKHA